MEQTITTKYLKDLQIYPSGLVLGNAEVKTQFQVFGTIISVGYDKNSQKFVLLEDAWGRARVFFDTKDNDQYNEEDIGTPVAFTVYYQNEWNGLANLIFTQLEDYNKTIKKIFNQNFVLFEKYWEMKHNGQERSVNVYKLTKAQIPLLKFMMENGVVHYKNDVPSELLAGSTAQFTQMHYFGLIMPVPNNRGHYQLTRDGINFLAGDISYNDTLEVINYGKSWAKGKADKEFNFIGTDKFIQDLGGFNEEELGELIRQSKSKQHNIFGDDVGQTNLGD